MVIKSDYIVDKGKWKLKRLTDTDPVAENVDEKQWHALEYILNKETDEHLTIPVDEVNASGSLINLSVDDGRTATISGSLTGLNKHKEESSIPDEIIEKLQEIGPW